MLSGSFTLASRETGTAGADFFDSKLVENDIRTSRRLLYYKEVYLCLFPRETLTLFLSDVSRSGVRVLNSFLGSFLAWTPTRLSLRLMEIVRDILNAGI